MKSWRSIDCPLSARFGPFGQWLNACANMSYSRLQNAQKDFPAVIVRLMPIQSAVDDRKHSKFGLVSLADPAASKLSTSERITS
jgi:hypothetical protein